MSKLAPDVTGFPDIPATIAALDLEAAKLPAREAKACSQNITTLPMHIKFDSKGVMELTRGASGFRIDSSELGDIIAAIAEREVG